MMNSASANRLRPVRDAVMDLHRAMLETERLSWQRLNGRIVTNAEALQLAINDPWFAWLRPLTVVLVALDDAMSERSAESDAQAPTLLDAVKQLLHPDESGNEFQQRYFEFVQRSPDVAVSHGRAMKALQAALKPPAKEH